jgi:hypothetical protein
MTYAISRQEGGMTRTMGIAALVLLCAPGAAAAPETPAERLFARLRGLEGEREGTLERTGARVPSMTSVYHVDGGELRMTHDCAARNQPRLRSRRIDEAAASVDLAFVDITPAGAEAGGHAHQTFAQLLPGDRVNIKFTFVTPKGEAVEDIVLRRVARGK